MLAFVPAAVSELLKRFPSTEGFLWVKFFSAFSIKKRHEHILKIVYFLSLRYSADFGRSRLVLILSGVELSFAFRTIKLRVFFQSNC